MTIISDLMMSREVLKEFILRLGGQLIDDVRVHC